jgi:uncharacterized membrane protein YdjX (TVP38/TMEM64 family)
LSSRYRSKAVKGRQDAGWWPWLLAVLFLAAGLLALVLWGPTVYAFLTNRERMQDWVEGFGVWAPAVIFGLEVGQVLLAPIPGQAIETISGYLFGPWLGVLYAFAGLALGSLLAFWLARRFGRPLAVRLAGQDAVARLDELAERGGNLFFFLIWLFPFVPDDLACLAAGLTPMTMGRFLLLMMAGRLPGILFSVWVGANLANIGPTWWIVLFVGVALAALLLWRKGNEIQRALLQIIQRLSSGGPAQTGDRRPR